MNSAGSLFSKYRDDFYAAILEFVGTTCFLTLGLGGIQAAASESEGTTGIDVQRILYISLSMGFSLLVSAWLFFRVTGGLFNPDISLALLLAGIISPIRFVFFCIAQLAGGITAAALVLALTPGPLASNTFLEPGTNPVQGVFIEAFITAALALAVLMLATEKHEATPFAPIGIGITLFVCHLFAVNYTGAGMNAARSFGPAVVTGFPYGTQWVYWVGPGLGAVFAAGFFALLKRIAYWRFVPTKDTTAHCPPDSVASGMTEGNTSSAVEGKGKGHERDASTGVNDSPV